MKESYVEGLAAHDGPESCVDVREDVGEALTGVRAGRVFSRERMIPPGCRRSKGMRKATSDVPLSRGAVEPRAVGDPVHVRKHLAREPGDPLFARVGGERLQSRSMAMGDLDAGRVGKSKDTRR